MNSVYDFFTGILDEFQIFQWNTAKRFLTLKIVFPIVSIGILVFQEYSCEFENKSQLAFATALDFSWDFDHINFACAINIVKEQWFYILLILLDAGVTAVYLLLISILSRWFLVKEVFEENTTKNTINQPTTPTSSPSSEQKPVLINPTDTRKFMTCFIVLSFMYFMCAFTEIVVKWSLSDTRDIIVSGQQSCRLDLDFFESDPVTAVFDDDDINDFEEFLCFGKYTWLLFYTEVLFDFVDIAGMLLLATLTLGYFCFNTSSYQLALVSTFLYREDKLLAHFNTANPMFVNSPYDDPASYTIIQRYSDLIGNFRPLHWPNLRSMLYLKLLFPTITFVWLFFQPFSCEISASEYNKIIPITFPPTSIKEKIADNNLQKISYVNDVCGFKIIKSGVLFIILEVIEIVLTFIYLSIVPTVLGGYNRENTTQSDDGQFICATYPDNIPIGEHLLNLSKEKVKPVRLTTALKQYQNNPESIKTTYVACFICNFNITKWLNWWRIFCFKQRRRFWADIDHKFTNVKRYDTLPRVCIAYHLLMAFGILYACYIIIEKCITWSSETTRAAFVWDPQDCEIEIAALSEHVDYVCYAGYSWAIFYTELIMDVFDMLLIANILSLVAYAICCPICSSGLIMAQGWQTLKAELPMAHLFKSKATSTVSDKPTATEVIIQEDNNNITASNNIATSTMTDNESGDDATIPDFNAVNSLYKVTMQADAKYFHSSNRPTRFQTFDTIPRKDE